SDVFRFLELNYPKGSHDIRQRIVAAVTAGPSGSQFEGISADTLLYERFNLLLWLRQVAPQCDYAREALETVRRVKPEFREREHPNLDFSFGEVRWLEASEGFNVQEITGQNIRDFIANRPPATDEDHFDSKRARYGNSISAAAAQQPEWALRFLSELASSDINEGDLWSSVVAGLRNANLSAEIWAAFLQVAM